MTEPTTGRRRTFAPVALLGLASAGLAAVAGHRAWVTLSASSDSEYSVLRLTGDDSATVPLAGALALVLLACWGVVLVTRGRVRRSVAGLAAVVSAAMVVTAVLGVGSASDGLRDDLTRLGVDKVSTSVGVWFWAAAVAGLLSLAATVLGVRLVPGWPEMGSRYDAPGAQEPAPVVKPEDQSSLDLWRAMDEGRDPTA
jgi:uncharacterized membrane protein (TIGR02234 family)